MLTHQDSERHCLLDGKAEFQGRSKVVAAFGRKPLNFRITSGLEATLEQPWQSFVPAVFFEGLFFGGAGLILRLDHIQF
jgi:hypothetical protein